MAVGSEFLADLSQLLCAFSSSSVPCREDPRVRGAYADLRQLFSKLLVNVGRYYSKQKLQKHSAHSSAFLLPPSPTFLQSVSKYLHQLQEFGFQQKSGQSSRHNKKPLPLAPFLCASLALIFIFIYWQIEGQWSPETVKFLIFYLFVLGFLKKLNQN